VFEEGDIRDAISCWETVRYISGVPVPGGGGLINQKQKSRPYSFQVRPAFLFNLKKGL
jgi:hypothetical protein